MEESESVPKEDVFNVVRELGSKGQVVINGIDDVGVADVNQFIKQPLDGILYDLNRLPEVIATFAHTGDPKWINDYAVYMTIKALKEKCDKHYSILQRLINEDADLIDTTMMSNESRDKLEKEIKEIMS